MISANAIAVKTTVAQFPAVLVTGARQVGKSTLLQHIGEGYQYYF